jgi:hypothetical protein
MSKRMTKMEACHHLTLLRDQFARELERLEARIRNDSGSPDFRLKWEKDRIADCDAMIRALEMAGTGLTR